MKNHSLAQVAYSQVASPTRTPRSLEYEVMARITHRIGQSIQRGPSGFPDLVMALDENRRLWSAFDSDVRDPNNSLPQDLRARIAYLAAYTFNCTGKILAGKAEATSLVEINTAVLRGLRGTEPGA